MSFPYVPVLEPGERDLKVPAWLNDTTLYHNRGDTTFAGEDALYGDFFGLDDLFTEHPRVVDGMVEIYRTWIEDFGVDGFRIDTMKHVDDGFWQAFGPAVLDIAHAAGKDEFFMFGEVFDGSRPFTSAYTTRNRMQAVLDFPFQGAARDFASRGTSAATLEGFFAADDWYTDADSNAYNLPTFLGNHDIGRIGSMIVADNPDAGDAEWLDRDLLAHELMYLSRGNPVVYYGDEQGFTGLPSDQAARQTVFASRVPAYLDDDLLGTDATHAQDNFVESHPLYEGISELAALTRRYPALRDGAHQNRHASDGPGVYAFSRIDRESRREFVVALNNSEQEQTVDVPTWVGRSDFRRVYGDGERRLRSARDGALTLTVPPLSTVVYRASDRIERPRSVPEVTLATPEPAEGARGRLHLASDVAADTFVEVTFQARTGDGRLDGRRHRRQRALPGVPRRVVAGAGDRPRVPRRRPRPARTDPRERPGVRDGAGSAGHPADPLRGQRGRGLRRGPCGGGSRTRHPRGDDRAQRRRWRLDGGRHRRLLPGVHGGRRRHRSSGRHAGAVPGGAHRRLHHGDQRRPLGRRRHRAHDRGLRPGQPSTPRWAARPTGTRRATRPS